MSDVTQRVLEHHLQSFATSDLEGILSDYTEESFLILPDGAVVQGLAQLKPVFEAFFAEFGKPGMTFNLVTTTVKDDVAFIAWTAETADNVHDLGSDTFVVKDGKIAAQTFASKTTPKS